VNHTIIWQASNNVFDSWGEEVDEKTALNLNLGMLYSQRKISWNDFLGQLGTAIGIASASPIFKELVASLILISMNAPKAKKTTDEMVDTVQRSLKVNSDLEYFIDLEDLEEHGNKNEVSRVIDWFNENKIGSLNEDTNHLELRSHIVRAMRIV